MSISNLLVPNHYHLNANNIAIKESMYAVPSAAATTFSTSAVTNVILDDVTIAPGSGGYVGATGIYTAPYTGNYLIHAGVQFILSINASGVCAFTVEFYIVQNGTTLLAGPTHVEAITGAGNPLTYTIPLTTTLYVTLTAGDTINLQIGIPTITTNGTFILNEYGGNVHNVTYLNIIEM